MRLPELIGAVRDSKGFRHKLDIQLAYAALRRNEIVARGCRVGDDCAAIPDGDGYLLFAIEGLLAEFVAAEPWFAGYCAVMVNVSDVYAMGGRPIAIVDALWSRDWERGDEIWAGMEAASRVYGVPIVGGHTNARSEHDYLAAAVLGRATSLLTSFDARPGDVLLAAIDLRGAYHGPYTYWNCSTEAPPLRLRDDLDVLPRVAESGLARAGKDVSMGGILGTAMMLLECSEIGATVDLDRIPVPPGVALEKWLQSFPSFGFLLSVAPENVAAVRALFAEREIACTAIGMCRAERVLTLEHDGASEVLWDFSSEPFTGAIGVATV